MYSTCLIPKLVPGVLGNFGILMKNFWAASFWAHERLFNSGRRSMEMWGWGVKEIHMCGSVLKGKTTKLTAKFQ